MVGRVRRHRFRLRKPTPIGSDPVSKSRPQSALFLLGILAGGLLALTARRPESLNCSDDRSAVAAIEAADDLPSLTMLATESVGLEDFTSGTLPAHPAERSVGPISLAGICRQVRPQGDTAPPTLQRLFCIWRN